MTSHTQDIHGGRRRAYLFSRLCVYLCRDSCQRGWRLLYILAAFHRCSDVMKPFVLKFLQDACDSPGMQYQGTSPHIGLREAAHVTLQIRLQQSDWSKLSPMCCSPLTGVAKACEQNLRRTFQYGGRIQYPNSMELKAMLVSLLVHCSLRGFYMLKCAPNLRGKFKKVVFAS